MTDALTPQLDPPSPIGRQVDRIRRLRNDNEYPNVSTSVVTAPEAEGAIAVAIEAVQAIRRVLPQLPPF